MDEYKFIVQDGIEGFERNLRAAVGTGDQIADRLFFLEARTPDAPDVLSVVMVQQYPDEMTPSPPGFDWGESPRQRVVHGVLRCHVSPYGVSGIEVIITCVDDAANAYGKLLAQEIDKRYPGSWQRLAEAEQEATATENPKPKPLSSTHREAVIQLLSAYDNVAMMGRISNDTQKYSGHSYSSALRLLKRARELGILDELKQEAATRLKRQK